MCRFTGEDEPNFVKVAMELGSLYQSLKTFHTKLSQHSPSLSHPAYNANVDKGIDDRGQASPRSQWFPGIYTRIGSLVPRAPNTCTWLFYHELYQRWFKNQEQNTAWGLLCLKGKPGAGKSILMGRHPVGLLNLRTHKKSGS